MLQNRIKRLLDDKVIEAVKQRERERSSQIDAKMAKINAREEEKTASQSRENGAFIAVESQRRMGVVARSARIRLAS